MSSAIEVLDLTKTYRNGTQALRGVEFSCPEGSAVAFIGPNGAGKTTTINILSTTLKPTSGSVLIMGKDVQKDVSAVRSLIGLCPQEFSMDPMLSVRENLWIYGRLRGLKSTALSNRIGYLLDRLGAGSLSKKMLFQISWGETKKVQISRELLVPPRVFLLDEPTAGLDPITSETVLAILQECRAQGTTLFVSSHQMDDLQSLCSVILFIDSGRITQTGSVDDFVGAFGGKVRVSIGLSQGATSAFGNIAAHALPEVELLSSEPIELLIPDRQDAYSRLLEFLSTQDLRITSLEVSKPTLKDAWLNLVQKRK